MKVNRNESQFSTYRKLYATHHKLYVIWASIRCWAFLLCKVFTPRYLLSLELPSELVLYGEDRRITCIAAVSGTFPHITVLRVFYGERQRLEELLHGR